MKSLDPTLQKLHEIEARVALAEFHIGEQRALVARLTRLGLHTSLAHELLRSMEDSLTILRIRQSDFFGQLQRVFPTPAQPFESPACGRRPASDTDGRRLPRE